MSPARRNSIPLPGLVNSPMAPVGMVGGGKTLSLSPLPDIANPANTDKPKRELTSAEALSCFVPEMVKREIQRDAAGAISGAVEREKCTVFEAAVLFADMSGFTALTERLSAKDNGAEKLCDAINAFFSVLLDCVEQYGGDCAKFAGDALTILWPVAGQGQSGPRTLQEATVQAARCSARVHEMLDDYPQTHGVNLTMHMGLGAGVITILYVGGKYGRWEFVVAGPPMAQIAIAEPLAAPGETVFSAEAWELLKDQSAGVPHAEDPNYIIQGAFFDVEYRIPPSTKTIVAGSQLQDIRRFIPKAIDEQLVSGYDGYLAEMRELTILFVNIANMKVTGAEGLGLTHRMMLAVQTAIYRFEGSINKLLIDDKGTLLLVAFGLPPLAHTDDPLRALAAADEMKQALNTIDLTVRVGVTTGDIFCGVVGSHVRREYTVMGDSVNLSARLMGTAKDNEILVDEATAKLCLKHVRFQTCPPIFVKGKVRAVRYYQLAHSPDGTTDGAWLTGERAALQKGKVEELLGRDSETGEVGNILGRIKKRRGGVLLVHGETGVGKTKFLQRAIVGCAERQGFAVLGSHTGSADFVERMPGRRGATSDWVACLSHADVLPSFHAWEGVLVQALTQFADKPGTPASGRPGGLATRTSMYLYNISSPLREQLLTMLPPGLRPKAAALAELLPCCAFNVQLPENRGRHGEPDKKTPLQEFMDSDEAPAIGQPAADREEALLQLQLEMLLAVLRVASQNKPCLCLLDNLHSFDTVSFRLMQAVLELTGAGGAGGEGAAGAAGEGYQGAGLSIVLVARPMAMTSFIFSQYSKVLEQARMAQTLLELGPLRRDDCDEFVRMWLQVPSAPQEMLDYCWGKSQGNCVFVEQLIKSILADQQAHLLEGECYLAWDPLMCADDHAPPVVSIGPGVAAGHRGSGDGPSLAGAADARVQRGAGAGDLRAQAQLAPYERRASSPVVDRLFDADSDSRAPSPVPDEWWGPGADPAAVQPQSLEDTVSIPAQLWRIVRERLDRLTSHQQMVLKVASLVPPPFEANRLLHVLDGSCRAGTKDAAKSQEEALQYCLDAGILTYAAGGKLIQFRSPMLREAAKKLLLSSQQQALTSRLALSENGVPAKRPSTLGALDGSVPTKRPSTLAALDSVPAVRPSQV